MKRLLKAIYMIWYYPAFKIGLVLGSIPARLGFDRITRMLMRSNAQLVILIRRARYKEKISEIGREWKRMFPLEGMQEIIKEDEDTVYFRTHGWCPLRGTDDVRACHLLMEFDRALLETIGGQLVVLRSQAQPGVKQCEVAIRRTGSSLDDLIPAYKHLKK